MIKFLFSIALCFAVFYLVNASDYENSFGFRAGFSSGITARNFITTNNTAGEIILILRRGGFNITGLYEKYLALSDNKLYFYYGGGAHMAFIYSVLWENVQDLQDPTVVGIDGLAGMEYRFAAIPFGISLDWKPALNLYGNTALRIKEFALSLNYFF